MQQVTGCDREVIGFWIQRSERVVPYHGEYAGHNETWRLHVGETPLLRCKGPGGRRWVTARRPATRLTYSFWSRIGACGNMHTDNEPKEGTHTIQLDPYGLAQAVDRGDARLAPGYVVVTVGKYSNGKPMRCVQHADGRQFEA